jgi:hypothetical protein
MKEIFFKPNEQVVLMKKLNSMLVTTRWFMRPVIHNPLWKRKKIFGEFDAGHNLGAPNDSGTTAMACCARV